MVTKEKAAQELVPASEAAVALGLSAEALRRRIQSGQLPGRLIGRSYFVIRAALERAMRERATETAAR